MVHVSLTVQLHALILFPDEWFLFETGHTKCEDFEVQLFQAEKNLIYPEYIFNTI